MAALSSRRRNDKHSKNGPGMSAYIEAYGLNEEMKSSNNRKLGRYAFVVVFVILVASFLFTDSGAGDQQSVVSETASEIRLADATSAIQRDGQSTQPLTTVEDNDDNNIKKEFSNWTWFNGDLNAYYNDLLKQDHKRDTNKIGTYAVHRWMGEKRSKEVHYELLHDGISRHYQTNSRSTSLRVLDAGCGLGSGLMWMEQKEPDWKLVGHTISQEQRKFIIEELPGHKFDVNLRSYDDLDQDAQFDFVYSIEALIHSPDIEKTMKVWSDHLAEGGVIAIIDDFVQVGTDKIDEEMVNFAKSWLANSLVTPLEFGQICRKYGLSVVEDRDLGTEYRINELNYRNQVPEIKIDKNKDHQGWMGSKYRQRLMLLGKLTYHLVILKKNGPSNKMHDEPTKRCESVPTKKSNHPGAQYKEITAELMSGVGKHGGKKIRCISGWYCCGKGEEIFDELEANRTDNTQFLKLPRNLFGHYIDSFAKNLNEYYATYPMNAKGRFLDIGGTGSTASGMKQVTSKFQHFAGPLDYWKLDSDLAAKGLERTLYCDIDDCPAAEDCGFDVTFSHTVLEHAERPWKSFDTISRITKKGGLTMHLVPFSYQFHATPDDYYRFSHSALTSLLEDRGFSVIDVGYDICTKPSNMLRRRDEHYDIIWLSYVVGKKN